MIFQLPIPAHPCWQLSCRFGARGGAHSSFPSPQAAPRLGKSGFGTAGPSACSGRFHAICLLWDICCVHAACSLAASNNFGCNFLPFGAWGCRLAAVGSGGAADRRGCSGTSTVPLRKGTEPPWGSRAPLPLPGEVFGLGCSV